MPELPEVETVVRGLRELTNGSTIVSAKITGAKLRSMNPRDFARCLANSQVTEIRRHGKHFFIDLNNNHTLWCHLRMTGRFTECDLAYKLDKHDHLYFDLQRNGGTTVTALRLIYRDVRKFGWVRLLESAEVAQLPELTKLGPDALTVTRKDFIARISARSRIIKPLLLDQTVVAGLGNIYADEMLFAAGIHPETMACDIPADKLTDLHKIMRAMLKRAIRRMGTTFDSYSGVNGNPGEFQRYLKVYNRDGEPCVKCGEMIVRKVIAQRSAHFCPKCQKN